ncbi:MAG: ABC transporter ATP-binding protein [Spirochaetaceae bacterium]|nr:ABC transporter ATP-binding protein [Spirochaetaceae bacterium]
MSDGAADTDGIIQVRELHKTYRVGDVAVEVLKGIDLSIAAGEFLAVMGPSGSGKSTLLYLLGGMERPTSGSVTIKGQEVAAMDDRAASLLRRRHVGFVFQFYNLIPNLNVEENLLLPALLDGAAPAERRRVLDDVLGAISLTHRRSHTPRELSGGEQQRVAIGRALINRPDIILADEPTGNLDSSTGEEIMALLARVNRDLGRTIVLVTHAAEAAACASRTVSMRDGRLEP